MAAISELALSQYFPLVAAIFGLCIGSFLNVVIHRLPKMMERDWREQCAELGAPAGAPDAPDVGAARYNLVVPRSRCPNCGHGITALENIPIVSWLVLRGKCSACAAPIAVRYPVVEIAAGAAAGYAAWRYGFSLAALGAMAFCWVMIALAFIDLDTQLLPELYRDESK